MNKTRTPEEWAADLTNFLSVPREKPDEWTAEEWTAYNVGYRLVLGGQGVQFKELCSDWPEVLQNEDIMRGWWDGTPEEYKENVVWCSGVVRADGVTDDGRRTNWDTPQK